MVNGVLEGNFEVIIWFICDFFDWCCIWKCCCCNFQIFYVFDDESCFIKFIFGVFDCVVDEWCSVGVFVEGFWFILVLFFKVEV